MNKGFTQTKISWIGAVLGLFLVSLPLVVEAQTAPTVTYEFDESAWEQGATTENNTITYGTLEYTVTVAHQSTLSNVTFGLFAHTVTATEVAQTNPSLATTFTLVSQTSTQKVYRVATTRSIVWTNGVANQAAYYYIRVTGGTDSDSNTIPTAAPPMSEWALADRIAPSVTYGSPISTGDVINVFISTNSIAYTSWRESHTINEIGLKNVRFGIFSLTAGPSGDGTDGIETGLTTVGVQWTTRTEAAQTVYNVRILNSFTWVNGGADPILYYYFKVTSGTDFVGNPVSTGFLNRDRADFIAPTVTFEFKGVQESARTTNTITYDSLVYEVTVNERVRDPDAVMFPLFAGKLDGTSEQIQSDIPSSNMLSDDGATVFTVTASRVWTNGGLANPTVYYYVGISGGTDLALNSIPTSSPPMDQWMSTDRIAPSTPTYPVTSLVESARTDDTISYSALNYSVVVNEVGLKGVGFKLYSHTIGGVETELTDTALTWTTNTNAQTTYAVTTGPLEYDANTIDPVVYYYVRLTTGTDFAGNAIPVANPPRERWAVADQIAPRVTYDLVAWESSEITSRTVTYSTLTYVITMDEGNLADVDFGLYSRTIGGVEVELTSPDFPDLTVTTRTDVQSSTTNTTYDVRIIDGTITWTNGGVADPIAYYYVRVTTGTDFVGNAIPQDAPAIAQSGLADRIPPTVTYDFDETVWDQGAMIDGETVTYSTLTYTVTVNEVALSGVSFGLFSRTIGEVETELTDVTIAWTTRTDTETVYTITNENPIVWNNGGADPIAYYYVRVTTGTDFGSNEVPRAAPPKDQWALADRVPPTVTYPSHTLTEASRTGDTITYNGLSYVVSINEKHLTGVTFGLFRSHGTRG